MRIFSALLLLLHTLAVSRSVSGAAVDRYDTDRPQRHTAVINFMDTTKDRRMEDESRSATTVEYSQGGEEEEYDYDEYYDEEEYDYDMSGDDDLEMPRVAMSSKPKDPLAILEAENTEGKRRGKGRKRAKGKGKKRNPCLKKYKDFCIHGTCQYLKDLRAPSCVCLPNYSGERCEFITLLPVQSPGGYSRTTALAVVAVVLSSVCLTIIVLLLMLRFHKRGAYDVENEEKVKLGLASNH